MILTALAKFPDSNLTVMIIMDFDFFDDDDDNYNHDDYEDDLLSKRRLSA